MEEETKDDKQATLEEKLTALRDKVNDYSQKITKLEEEKKAMKKSYDIFFEALANHVKPFIDTQVDEGQVRDIVYQEVADQLSDALQSAEVEIDASGRINF